MSNIIENLKIRGDLNIKVIGSDGVVKDDIDHRNLVVTTGLTFIASRMAGTAKAVMSHMALGSGNTAAAGANSALETQVGSRVALDSTTPATTSIQYVATFAPGASTGAITEAGIFNAATGGDMLCRTVFPVVNKQAGDTIVITWTISLSAA